jgi:hypothetical protein
MASLSILANRITATQEESLSKYPFIFIEGVKEASIEYDFSADRPTEAIEDVKNMAITYKITSPTKPTSIKYNLTVTKEAANEHLDKRFAALENAVRTLFWKDTVVEVTINNKLSFKSK